MIEAQHVQKAFGEKVLFSDLNFTLPPNGIIGVIGPNGAGKTTLFRLIMGLDTPDSGTFELGETVKLSYVDQQHKDIDPNKSVYEVVSQGNELMRMGGRDINARAYLSRFNFSGSDQEKKCGVLSGGERNRLHLAMALKQEGNVLLLDEPTNDLDIATLQLLEEYLADFRGCVIVVSHDRYFMDRVVDHLLVFRGQGVVEDFPGNYSQYREFRELKEKEEVREQRDRNSAADGRKPVLEGSDRKRKLTFKEKQEYEALGRDIEALEAEKAQLHEALASGQLSVEEITAHSKRLPLLDEELDEKSMRWLELSEWA